MSITNRNSTADLAKGIALLLIIQVHLTEVFAETSFYEGLLGKISLFLGGPPVAPVYMLIMGYFIAASRRSFLLLIRRGVTILAVAFFLNLALNFHLLLRIWKKAVDINPWNYVFGVDILFLAGFSILILAALKPFFKNKWYLYLTLAVCVAWAAPGLNRLLIVNGSAAYFLAFFGGDFWWSYFPLFPWLAYPLLGCGIYRLNKQYPETFESRSVQLYSIPAIVIILMFWIKFGVSTSVTLDDYYHHGLQFFLWTVLFLALWFTIIHLVETNIPQNLLNSYFQWLGRNIIIAYIAQWLLIGNIGTALYKTQSLPQLIIWNLLILVLSSLLVFLFLLMRRQIISHLKNA
ncbi:acyltransferase family protein [Calditrichota bacterium]